MRPSTSLALSSALLASNALAASSTASGSPSVVSVFFLGSAEPSAPLVGSIIHSDASKTTMAVTCATSACGYPSTVTATFGPSTFEAVMAYPKITLDLHCSIYGSTASASCVETITGAENNVGVTTGSATESDATSITTRTTSSVLSGTALAYYPITVTAGHGVSVASSSNAAASSSASSASAMTSSQASSASASGSAAAASSSGAARQLRGGLAGGAVGVLGGIMAVL